MKQCKLCGKTIRPYFEFCYDCSQKKHFTFPEPIKAREFMERFGIDSW